MAAGSKPKYYLVEASVLPEIFAKVIEAKELLETGQVRTVADAVARVDISRSAFYQPEYQRGRPKPVITHC